MGADHDDVVITREPVRAVGRLLEAGYGAVPVPDVLAVTLRGSLDQMDRETRDIVDAVRSLVPDAVLAVAGTGSAAPVDATPARDVTRELSGSLGAPAVDAVGADGVFLGQGAEAAGISSDRVADALRSQTTIDGGPRFLDAYAGYAIELARYC